SAGAVVRYPRPAGAARDGPRARGAGRGRLSGPEPPPARAGSVAAVRPAPARPEALGLGYTRRPPQSIVAWGPFVLPFGRPARRERVSGGSSMTKRDVAGAAAAIVIALPAGAFAQLGRSAPASREGLPAQEHYRLRLEYSEWRPDLTGNMLKNAHDTTGTIEDLNDDVALEKDCTVHARGE